MSTYFNITATDTANWLFSAEDAKAAMVDLGLVPADSKYTVFIYGKWTLPINGKVCDVIRWSPFTMFLLYWPRRCTGMAGDPCITFMPPENDDGNMYIDPLKDERWREHLAEWFDRIKKEAAALAADIHNDEITKAIDGLE